MLTPSPARSRSRLLKPQNGPIMTNTDQSRADHGTRSDRGWLFVIYVTNSRVASDSAAAGAGSPFSWARSAIAPAAFEVSAGPRFVDDPDSVSRYLYGSPRPCWPRCVNAQRPMTDRCRAGSDAPSNTSCERTPAEQTALTQRSSPLSGLDITEA